MPTDTRSDATHTAADADLLGSKATFAAPTGAAAELQRQQGETTTKDAAPTGIAAPPKPSLADTQTPGKDENQPGFVRERDVPQD